MRKLMVMPLLLLLLAACSKENRIQRHLYSKEGKWNLDEYKVANYENGAVLTTGTLYDAGYFIFEKNGIFASVLPIFEQNTAGTWASTEDEVLLIYADQAFVLSIREESRNNLLLENTQVYSDSTRSVTTFKLSRHK